MSGKGSKFLARIDVVFGLASGDYWIDHGSRFAMEGLCGRYDRYCDERVHAVVEAVEEMMYTALQGRAMYVCYYDPMTGGVLSRYLVFENWKGLTFDQRPRISL